VTLASIASAAYLWYASGRGRLLRPDAPRAQIRALRARSVSASVFFALTLPIAVFAPSCGGDSLDLDIPPLLAGICLVL